MAYDFSEFKKRAEETKNWLDKEFSGIRTGMATPSVLDGVTVDAYGSRMPINQVATVTVEGPRTLMVTPWDSTLMKNIEKAIHNSGLGLSVNVGDTSIRVGFPELTSENRESLVKLLRQKEEQAKVSARTEREKVWDDIQEKFRDGEITEDDKFRHKDELQKLLDGVVKELGEKSDRKEKEIREN